MTDSQPPAEPSGQPDRTALPLALPARVELILLGLILLLALALRAYELGLKSLWLDEVVYARSAQLGGLFGPYGLASISHPPGYLFLIRVLSGVSRADWFLRLPALIASVGGVLAVWALGRATLGQVEGLLAAFFLALSAIHVEYAQEVHSYALFGTLSTVQLWALYRAAQRYAAGTGDPLAPGWRARLLPWLRTWGPFVLAAILNLYIHYYAIAPVGLSVVMFPLFLLAAGPGTLPSLWRDPAGRRAWRGLLAALAVVALLYLPQVVAGLAGSAQVAGERSAAVDAGLLETGFSFTPALFGDTLLAFVTNRTPWNLDPLFFLVTMALLLGGTGWLLWRRRPLGIAFLLWMVLPLPLIAWFAYEAGFSFAPRRLMFILPAFMLVVASGVTALARLAGRLWTRLLPQRADLAPLAGFAFIGLVALAFAKGSMDPLASYYQRPKQDWKTLATILDTMPGPNDTVVLLPSAAPPLEWYYDVSKAQIIGEDLVPKLQELCAKTDAIYVAAAGTGARSSAADVHYLTDNFIQVPMRLLNLYYRNCQPDLWYGDGAAPLFQLAYHPKLPVRPTRLAAEEYEALAARQGLEAAAASIQAGTTATEPSPQVNPAEDPAAEAEPAQERPTAIPVAERPPVQETAAPAMATNPASVEAVDPAQDLETLLAYRATVAPAGAAALTQLAAYRAQAGDIASAGEYFQQAINRQPDYWLAYTLWAHGLGNAGKQAEGLEVARQGLAVAPESEALRQIEARLLGEEVVTGDDVVQPLLDEARAALSGRDWEGAIEAAQAAVAAAPDRYEAYLLLGDAYRGGGQLGEALDAYQQAVGIAPHLGFLHARAGEALARLGRADEALVAGLNAVAIDESRWEDWLALGRAYGALAASDPQAAPWARSTLERAAALAPEGNQAPQRALADLAPLLAQAAAPPAATVEPTPEKLLTPLEERRRGEELLEQGQPEEALAAFQAAVDGDATDRNARMGLAASLAQVGRVDEALATYQQITGEWPDFPFAHVRRGELLEDAGDLEGAIAAYQAAVEAAPDNADVQFVLAYALRRAERIDEAIAAFEAGLALDPDRQAARDALAGLQASGQ